MRLNVFITTTAICLFGGSLALASNVTQINRYATVENKALVAQINPLLAVQKVHFPQEVKTLSDALTYWLQYSGFRMANCEEQSKALQAALLLPLPSVVRNLGPLTVEEGLVVLVGKNVFLLKKDFLHRKVNFVLKPPYQSPKGIKA